MYPKPELAHQLRRRLDSGRILPSMGIHDVLSALLMERAGFEALFLGGFGLAATQFGLPDLGFLGLTDVCDAVRRTTARLEIPLIADADTGFGGPAQVAHTVEQLNRSGAAGILLEDQVAPKKCGHFEGHEVIPADDMVAKIRSARSADSDVVLFARTDARSTHGLVEAIDRVRKYCDAGADVAFIEAPRSRDEIETIAREVEHPKMINMLAFGRTPILSTHELEQLGFAITVAPIASLLSSAFAIQSVANAFRDQGDTRELWDHMISFEEIRDVLNFPRWQEVHNPNKP